MIVTVRYDGIPIVTGAPCQPEGEGLFVTCEFPMPVGTSVKLEVQGEPLRPARVSRVVEGKQGAGMALEWGEPAPPPPMQAPTRRSSVAPKTASGPAPAQSGKTTPPKERRKRRRE